MALLQSSRERRLVAYHRHDQEVGFFCVGWFDRFEGTEAIFADVPKEVFGGDSVGVDLDNIAWIQQDTPYLRGLEQVWAAGCPPLHTTSGETFKELEYIETVLFESLENGQVVEIELKSADCRLLAQVHDVENDAVFLQEFFDDDASSYGSRWCRIGDIAVLRKHTDTCIKLEILLGLPQRFRQHLERHS